MDPANEVWFSVVSIWEMAIKAQLNKLTLHLPLSTIAQQQLANGMHILNIELHHILGMDQLPLHHKDPFDRLLVSQANALQASLVTIDPIFARYPVQTLW